MSLTEKVRMNKVLKEAKGQISGEEHSKTRMVLDGFQEQ